MSFVYCLQWPPLIYNVFSSGDYYVSSLPCCRWFILLALSYYSSIKLVNVLFANYYFYLFTLMFIDAISKNDQFLVVRLSHDLNSFTISFCVCLEYPWRFLHKRSCFCKKFKKSTISFLSFPISVFALVIFRFVVSFSS